MHAPSYKVPRGYLMPPAKDTMLERGLALLRQGCSHADREEFEPRVTGDLGTDNVTDETASIPLTVSGVAFWRCKRCGYVRANGAIGARFLTAVGGLVSALLPGFTGDITVRLGTTAAEAKSVGAVEPALPDSRRKSKAVPETSITDLAAGFRSRVVAPKTTMEEVVLAEATQRSVLEALEKIRSYSLIYQTWGFESIDPKGRSVTLNFYGASGTGKSRTAEAIAHTLGMPILLISAADVEARYMGDSPRNVRAIFQAAREAGAMLFFDEADALFGRRASEVTQGVDHEVNAIKTTLLTELDAFDGVVVLATNLQEVIDPAFIRRIAWHVRFHKPDREARRRLWELHLVPGIPLAEPRDTLVEFLVDESEGKAGGDFLTALRIGLPAAVRRCSDQAEVRVSRADLAQALGQVSEGYLNVGVRRPAGPSIGSVTPFARPKESVAIEVGKAQAVAGAESLPISTEEKN